MKTAVAGGVESRMDPRIQLEQSLTDARRQDLDLRNQAARVIAHRTEVQMQLDKAVESAATAKTQAAQALRNADAAQKKGDAGETDRWNRAAQAVAMQLESSESMIDSLKQQYTTANQQADVAKQAVNDNAMQLQSLSAKRMELLGKLEQAKMQEEVNKTMRTLSAPVDSTAPTMSEIEDKIDRRMALASAGSELDSSSVEGAQRELSRSIAQAGAQSRLDSLRQELGIGAAPEAAAIGAADGSADAAAAAPAEAAAAEDNPA